MGFAQKYGLIEANAYAYEYYANVDENIERIRSSKTCYASGVKAAMMLDTTKWSLFLPDTISDEDKSNAYGDGLKRYCVASGFESNHIADCSELKKECLEDAEKNGCKEADVKYPGTQGQGNLRPEGPVKAPNLRNVAPKGKE